MLVWPSGLRRQSGCFGGVGKGKNEKLVEKRAVPIIPSPLFHRLFAKPFYLLFFLVLAINIYMCYCYAQFAFPMKLGKVFIDGQIHALAKTYLS